LKSSIDGELKGTYYPLGGLKEEQTNVLLEIDFFPKGTSLLTFFGTLVLLARGLPIVELFHNEA
jgi:hypothetical protein